MGIILLSIILFVTGLCIRIWIRNDKVYKFYCDLITTVGERNKRSIKDNKPWRWRFKEMPSQSKMVLYFWRPYESFFDRQRLLGPDPDDVPEDIYKEEQ